MLSLHSYFINSYKRFFSTFNLLIMYNGGTEIFLRPFFCEGILFVELRGTRMCSEQRALYVVKATWFYIVLAAWNSCFSTTLPLLTLFSNHWKSKQRLKILSKLVYSFAAVTFIQEHIAVAVVIVLLKVLRKAKYSSHSHWNIMTLVLHYITT